MTKRGTIQDIADATEVDQATVRRALKAAGLVPGRGGYQFDDAVKIVEAIADKDRVMASDAAGRAGGGARLSPYAEAKTQSELHRARKLQIENEVAEGKLIDRQSVHDTGVNLVTEVRTALLAVGNRVAGKLVGLSDTTEIATIVEAGIRDVLATLADEAAFVAAIEAELLS